MKIIKRSYTLMEGSRGHWFGIEERSYLGHRRIFIALGSPLGYSNGTIIDGDVWALLLTTSALDFCESVEEWRQTIKCAQATVGSSHNTAADFWRRMDGFTPRPAARGWRATRWSHRPGMDPEHF